MEQRGSQTSCDTAAASVVQHGSAYLLAFYRFIFIFALLFCSPPATPELCNDLIHVCEKILKEDKIGLHFS